MEQPPEYFYTLYLSDVLNEKKLLECSSLWENQVQILFLKLLSKEGLTWGFMQWYGSSSASFFLTVHQAAKHFNLKSKTLLHSLMWGDVSFVAAVGALVVWREPWKSGGLLLSGVSGRLPWSLDPHFLSSNYNCLYLSYPSNPFTQHPFMKCWAFHYSGRSSQWPYKINIIVLSVFSISVTSLRFSC